MRNALLFAALLLVGCGGGGGSTAPPPKPGIPIDPSGNWSMSFKDSLGGGATIKFAALFSQVGTVVTGVNFSVFGTPPPFSCIPFAATMSGGEVQNLNTFVGNINITNFGTFSFSATLAPDGKSFAGTYSNMPACAGINSSGTFSGQEIPTVSGTWTGTLQACTFDGTTTTAACPPTQGGETSTVTMQLVQNDVTGMVTGTYAVSNLPNFSNGTVTTGISDLLSGVEWQFTLTDANPVPGCVVTFGAPCTVHVVNGQLNDSGGFSGTSFWQVGNDAPGQHTHLLTMSH